MIELKPFTATSPYLEEAVKVYADTWGRSWRESSGFFREYVRYPDFHGMVALAGAKVTGMGFGTRSQRGQWWHDKVAQAIGADHPALQDAWVLIELAVLAYYRNRGIGGRLHDALLEAQPYPRALLSTEVTNQGARRLYERLGWRYLHPGLAFSRGRPSFVIMHKEL